jgi:hypothetical protein
MYVWIWRHLPGGLTLRAVQVLILVAAVAAVLLFLVFPWADHQPWIPFNNVTVDNSGNLPGGTP